MYNSMSSAVPSFSLNSCKTFSEIYEENTDGRFIVLVNMRELSI